MSQSDTSEQAAYQVLARKYRPGHFRDLIGQEAMVTTLTNAFAAGRIAHAYLLTGVRGVGKTTTARIIAKGLNCTGRGDGPTIDPCGKCPACVSIAAGRHVDVIEMDAASNTGVDDVREIIDAVRYRAVEARYKVYIVDEVHMLSTNAFNALLKTLEEPPEHVVFLFATTEIRKVPVTVLSRCQRFDLRRIEPEVMLEHLAGIAAREGAEIAAEALGLVVRAAEGSVRDALSLLDQAIAHGAAEGGRIEAPGVRAMLGLADRGRVFDLFEAVMRGDAPGALEELSRQYVDGADPAVVLRDLAELTHWLSVLKISPALGEDPTIGPAERDRGRDLAGRLSMRSLSRAWQMLLKVMEELPRAPTAMMAAEMAVIRLTHVADLPTPGEIVARIEGQEGPAPPPTPGAPNGGPAGVGASGTAMSARARTDQSAPSTASASPTDATASARVSAVGETPGMSAVAQAASMPSPSTGAALALVPSAPEQAPAAPEPEPEPDPVEAAAVTPTLARIEASLGAAGEWLLANHLVNFVRPVRLRPGVLEIALAEGAPADLPGRLTAALSAGAAGPADRLAVVVSGGPAGPTLVEDRRAAAVRIEAEAREHPLVAAALAAFPGATIKAVRPLGAPEGGPSPGPNPGPDADDFDDILLDAEEEDDEDDLGDPFEER
ncbi:MAG: DNA polymerase III subunit gamma/tau [Pseudomonadota bacterium]